MEKINGTDIMSEDYAVKHGTGENVEELEEDDNLVIVLDKPYKFEGKEYKEIDLTALEDVTAEDMIKVNKYIERTAGRITPAQELTLEYACVLAARVCNLPIEFFMGLPAKPALKVKNRVVGFLFG